MKHQPPWIDRIVFLGLQALILFSPIPLGSNRPLLIGMLCCWVFGLALLWLAGWAMRATEIQSYPRRIWILLAPLPLWLLLLAFQATPLPEAVVDILSPKSAEAYRDAASLGLPVTFSISVERNDTLQGLVLSAAYVLVIALLVQTGNSRARIRQLCATLVASGTIQAFMGIYLGFSEAHYTLFFREIVHAPTRITGGFINPNSLAAFLEICLGAGIGLMIAQFEQTAIRTAKQRIRWVVSLLLSPKFALRMLLIIMVAALILTRSRGGNGAFFICTLVVGMVGLTLLRSTSRAITVFFVSMILIDVFLVGSWVGVDRVAQRLEQTAILSDEKTRPLTGEESLEERRVPTSVALKAWRDYPLFGSGSGTFSYIYPGYRPLLPTGLYEHAHNDYAEFLLETGAIGFGLLAVVYAGAMAICIWAVRKRHDQFRRGIALGCFFSLLCIGIHMNVDMPLQVPATAIALCAVIALAWLCALGKSDRHHIHQTENDPYRD